MADLTMYRGDTPTWDIACKLADDSACDLTGAKVWFTAKTALTDLDAAAIIAKSTTTTGLTVTAPATAGVARLTLVKGDTSTLAAVTTTLYYDVQVLESTGNLATVASGRLFVYADSTIAST